jgi:tRNA 2-thiocytidine biosynthesis protein TtcA
MISKENNIQKNLFKKLSRKSGKTIHEHSLLKPGDRLLVGLSGGKDSLVLLELLKDRWKAAPFQFEIFAAHVEISDSGYSANEQYLKSFCEDLNIPFFIERVSAGITENPEKAPCFLCSWHRRKKLFDLTKTLNCNVLSFGHHRDDALETFMINLLHHGSVSSLPYKLRMFNGRIHLIRPLLDIWEDEIEEYSRLRGFNPINTSCSFENNNKRKHVREWIEKMNTHYSKSKINMFRALGNIYPEYLPGSTKNE